MSLCCTINNAKWTTFPIPFMCTDSEYCFAARKPFRIQHLRTEILQHADGNPLPIHVILFSHLNNSIGIVTYNACPRTKQICVALVSTWTVKLLFSHNEQFHIYPCHCHQSKKISFILLHRRRGQHGLNKNASWFHLFRRCSSFLSINLNKIIIIR